ncbi:MAG: dTDP-glucose 4,6-dehydratase [Candidatus Moranbacteria bacterium]|nr:dTDP-glucose 4,6-dehydratase [Candidatus Moranbacteria bacterium]
MKYLITGGAGFIGSNFVRHILKNHKDATVTNIDALTYAGNLGNLKDVEEDDRYTFIHGDICNQDMVDELVKKTDIIVHFAAESHVDRSVRDATAFVKTNVAGTLTLLDSAKKHGNKRFHHVSTDEVFGALKKDDSAFTEETPYDPRSPYSASKAASDHLVRAYFHTHNLPMTISNCSNNYGPFHFPEKLIPLAITNLLEGKKVPIYGKGDQVRDWLHVNDHCLAIDKIITNGTIGKTYLIGGDAQTTNNKLVRMILEIMNKDESFLETVQDRPGHDFRYAINHDKITKELGWVPETSLDKGLQDTVQWYSQNKQWWQEIKSGQYRKYYEQQYGEKK